MNDFACYLTSFSLKDAFKLYSSSLAFISNPSALLIFDYGIYFSKIW
jgi:hypothetical protein